METNLIPYHPEDDIDIFEGYFMIPADWKSCGPVIHIAGAPKLSKGQPVILALTDDMLFLCTQEKPGIFLQVRSITDVKVEDLSGISFQVNTPSGVTEMVPQVAKGVGISYKISTMKLSSRLMLYTLIPNIAYEWTHEILSAVESRYSELGKKGGISRRQV